jgi:hypothetical protein
MPIGVSMEYMMRMDGSDDKEEALWRATITGRVG